jgi:hypothetical protein
MKTPPATHIPFNNAACESCHAATNYGTFGGTPMNHAPVTGIMCATCHETGKSWYGVTIVTRPTPAQDPLHPPSGDCGQCHNTTSFAQVTGKPPNHIPTSQPCSLCHSNPGNYQIYAMNHAGITSGCATCHAAGLNFVRGIPKPPPANHLPTTKPCETCHAASNFTSWGGTPMNHAGITSGCAGCHAAGSSFYGVTMKTPPANHVPTTKPCETCHAPTNYTTFAGTQMNHAGIVSGCASCHGPGMTWFGVTIVVPPAGATPHIPYNNAACEACHSSSNFTTFRVNAKSAMNHGVVSTMPCKTCHEYGLKYHWYGFEIQTRPSPTHHASQDCGASGCHVTTSFEKRAIVRALPGQPVTRTTGARDAQAETAGPATALPNPGSVTADTRTGPKPAARTHVGIAPGSCAGCHNGSVATAKPGKHLATVSSCDSCHRTTSWIPAAFTHTGAALGSCASCHNGMSAAAKSPAHFATVRACDSCHTTASWSARVPYRHLSPAYSPHNPSMRCVSCHLGNGEVVAYKHPAQKPDCGACHVDRARMDVRTKPGVKPRVP